MEIVTITEAKEHLEDLIERAARGEDVRISVPALGSVQLRFAAEDRPKPQRGKRKLGQLAGKMTVPARRPS